MSSSKVSRSLQTAADNYLGAMAAALRDKVDTPAERLDFLPLNDIWPSITTDAFSPLPCTIAGTGVYIEGDGRPASLSYPLHILTRQHLANRFHEPVRRLLDEFGFMMPRGTLVLDRAVQACFDQATALIHAFEQSGEDWRTESILLRERLEEYGQYHPEQNARLIKLDEELDLPALTCPVNRLSGKATTHTRLARNLCEALGQQALPVVELVAGLRALRGALGAMRPLTKMINLAPALENLQSHVDHDHPMVRDLTLVALNRAAAVVFLHGLKRRNALCQKWLECLVGNHIDLDINLARLSIVYEAAGDSVAATDTWTRLCDLSRDTTLELPVPDSRTDTLALEQWRSHARGILDL